MLYPSEWVGSLELKRNSSKSGFCGVIPAGKKWQARIYKPEKQRWDLLGTYPTAHEAAVVAATAKQKLESGQRRPCTRRRTSDSVVLEVRNSPAVLACPLCG